MVITAMTSQISVSLSARRAWIEIVKLFCQNYECFVALRKESVDRNCELPSNAGEFLMSLSARRAWIEMRGINCKAAETAVALRKESVDRNSIGRASFRASTVALRKESVDRNGSFAAYPPV